MYCLWKWIKLTKNEKDNYIESGFWKRWWKMYKVQYTQVTTKRPRDSCALSSLTFQQPIFTFREYDMRYAIKQIHNLTTVICTLRNVISLFYICTFYCYLTLYTICTDEQCFMPHKCWHFDFYQIKPQTYDTHNFTQENFQIKDTEVVYN